MVAYAFEYEKLLHTHDSHVIGNDQIDGIFIIFMKQV